MNTRAPGRHFLQIPGPTDVPGRVLRAISEPTIDHRGPEFAELGRSVLTGLKRVFKTDDPVLVFPASGTGAWEAALVNTLSPGDALVMPRTGWFASLWSEMAKRLGLEPILLETDWRRGADPAAVEAALRADKGGRIRAVCIVHNETSTGCVSAVPAVRRVIDTVGHPALLLVDTISSLASIDYRHQEWGVDVTIAGSQKGLMLPPGLSFNAVSACGLEASKTAKLPRSYWDWRPMLEANAGFYFPYTPATNLLRGLKEALTMLEEEGLGRGGRCRTAMPGAGGLFVVADRDSPQRGLQRRRVARPDFAAVQHEPWQRPRDSQGSCVSDRPSRGHQRPHASRRYLWRGDGTEACRRADRKRRRRRRNGELDERLNRTRSAALR
jgi:aspartate aminotransferase-like enzyme